MIATLDGIKKQSEWTTEKVIDFINWYVKLKGLPERFELENQTIIESFLKGDDYKIWKPVAQSDVIKNIEKLIDVYQNKLDIEYNFTDRYLPSLTEIEAKSNYKVFIKKLTNIIETK